MSSICPPPLLRRLVDLDVFDDQIACVQAFGVCIRFCVLEEAEEEFGAFLWPAGFGDAELFACCVGGCVSDRLLCLLLSSM